VKTINKQKGIIAMDAIHTEIRNGLTIKIFQDDCPEGPDSWGDNNLFLVAFHRDFWVKGPKTKAGYFLITKEEARDYLEHDGKDVDEDGNETEMLPDYHIFPLSAHIHGGIRLYLGHISKDWDNSLLGLVAVSKKEWPDRAKAEEAGESLVSTWNDYLDGNIYGFMIQDAQDRDIESCWGFYGDYDKEGGALLEARAIVDHITNKGQTDHHGQELMPWANE
jgi:hypothetical protein